MWTDNYIGIPFRPDGRDRDGCDCYGLVCLVYKEMFNINLPLFKGVYCEDTTENLVRVARTMAAARNKWKRVDTPKPFDGIMLRTGEYTWHVGVVVDKRRFLHVQRGTESIVDEYTGIEWKDRIDGFYRYE